MLRHRCQQAQPREDRVPCLLSEGACEQQVPDRLGFLVTQEASRVVLQTVTGKSLSGPASVLACQPMEEFHPWRHPTVPSKFPGVADRRSLEGGLVAGLR